MGWGWGALYGGEADRTEQVGLTHCQDALNKMEINVLNLKTFAKVKKK